jgi:hypothetical protein
MNFIFGYSLQIYESGVKNAQSPPPQKKKCAAVTPTLPPSPFPPFLLSFSLVLHTYSSLHGAGWWGAMDGKTMRDEKEKEKQDSPPPAVGEGREAGQDMDWY